MDAVVRGVARVDVLRAGRAEAAGVYVTEHLLVFGASWASVHVVELKLPRPSWLNVTVPSGKEAPAPFVSETVAVQVVDEPASTEDGAHETLVEVVLAVMLNVELVSEVNGWIPPPPVVSLATSV